MRLTSGELHERGYRNRDYIETINGQFFTVVGDIHPVERVLAYLKYVPDEKGEWGVGTRRYRRILRYYTTLHLEETFAYLERMYPQYMYNSEVQHLLMSAVPLEYIRRHHIPEQRLHKLVSAKRLDLLERKAVDLAMAISKESHVDLDQLGVTGSILVNIHNPRFSDIDLTVYGRRNSHSVKKTVSSLLDGGQGGFLRFNEDAINEWLMSRAWLYPLNRNEVELIYRRHWNHGVFKGTVFSIHPGKIETEIDERYGDRTYSPEGTVKVEATIDDSSDSMFMPGTYRVGSVEIISGPTVSDVREIVTYEGLYCDIASDGDRVRAQGKLEKVEDRRTKDVYHRVLVGSVEAKGTDYLMPEQS